MKSHVKFLFLSSSQSLSLHLSLSLSLLHYFFLSFYPNLSFSRSNLLCIKYGKYQKDKKVLKCRFRLFYKCYFEKNFKKHFQDLLQNIFNLVISIMAETVTLKSIYNSFISPTNIKNLGIIYHPWSYPCNSVLIRNINDKLIIIFPVFGDL